MMGSHEYPAMQSLTLGDTQSLSRLSEGRWYVRVVQIKGVWQGLAIVNPRFKGFPSGSLVL
jgi:hypothetical protein